MSIITAAAVAFFVQMKRPNAAVFDVYLLLLEEEEGWGWINLGGWTVSVGDDDDARRTGSGA